MKQSKEVRGILEKMNPVVKVKDRLTLKDRVSYCEYRRYHNKYGLEGIRRVMKGKNKLLSSYQVDVNRCQGIIKSRESDRREIKELKQCLRRR